MPSVDRRPALFWGDGHTHSNWSDGLDTLPENARLFTLYGEDYHFATDHLQIDVSHPGYHREVDEWSRRLLRLQPGDLAAYEAECCAASSPSHLTIPGLELIWANASEGRFGAAEASHILVREHLDRLPEPAFFRGRSLIEILRELHARGTGPFLAHVGDHLPWDDLQGDEIAGLELRYDIESRVPPTEHPALQHWDRWLGQGKHLAISCGSDCHQMDLWAAAAMRNVTAATELTPEAVREALRLGRGYHSATWHPDLYLELGYAGIAAKSGGFTPWWRLLGAEQERWFDRPPAKVQFDDRTIAAALPLLGEFPCKGVHLVAFTVENGDCLHCLDDLVDAVTPLELLGAGITLDTGHANVPGGWGSFGSSAGFALTRGRLVSNIHLHDNDGKDDRHWAPGQGNIDFAGPFAAFRQAGVAPIVTFEFSGSDEEYVQAAAQVRAWWDGHLPIARTSLQTRPPRS